MPKVMEFVLGLGDPCIGAGLLRTVTGVWAPLGLESACLLGLLRLFLRDRVQQSLQDLLVELRLSRREMAARFVACKDEKEPAVFQTLHGPCHKARFRRVDLIVDGVDREDGGLNFLKVT